MANLITQVPIPNTPMVSNTGVPVKAWFDFFTTLWLRTGGNNNNVSIQLDQIGAVRGGMLARFASEWLEFEATVANTVPVMNPGADVQLLTVPQLLAFVPSTGSGALVFGTGPTFSDGTVTINPTAASLTQGLVIDQSGPIAGSQAGASTNCAGQGQPSFAYNSICVSSEQANITGGAPSYTFGLNVGLVTGGVNSQGQKVALGVQLRHNVASAPASGRDHVAIQTFAVDDVGDGGINTGAGSAGTLFGGGFTAHALSGATNLTAVVGSEFDVQIEAGATAKWRLGVSSVGGGTVRGAGIDAAYEIGATSANAAFLMGLCFANIHGGAPIATTGTLIGTDGTGFTITKGIDLSAVTVTGNFIIGPQSKFLVNNVGSVTAGDGTNDNTIVVNGKAAGTGGGAIIGVQNIGAYIIAMGNASNIVGGAYDATPLIYSGTTLLKFYVSGIAVQFNSISTASTSATTGTAIVTGGLGVSGAIWAGTYVATTPTTVAGLPAAAAGNQGARMFVTDSNAASFTAGIGAVVAAGGATKVPVVSDGTNWRIG